MNSGSANQYNRNSSRRSKTNKTIIIVTITFILMTLPGAICSFYYSELLSIAYGSLIIFFFDCVTFSYHSLNFLFLFFTNNIYKKEFKKFLNFKFQIIPFRSNNSNTAGISRT